MLRRFEVEGFKNFNKKVVLDFTDVKDYRFNLQCITDNTIAKMVIYGKNSSGKTNLGLALFDIVSHLTSKHVGDDLYSNYLNADSLRKYCTFRYVFQFDTDVIDYSYAKNSNREIVFEKVLLNKKALFEIDKQSNKYLYDGVRELSNTINLEMQDVDSVLKYLISNTVLEADHPLRKLNNYVNHMLWIRSLGTERYIGYKTDSKDYYSFIFEENNLAEFQQFLYRAGVMDELAAKRTPEGDKRLYIRKAKLLPFRSAASNGTKALYTFFYWYKTSPEVSLLFIDEFDAFYHYELSESIVALLEQMSNTQVILTSHNTNLLTNRIMRPDCYYVLSNNRITSVARATSRELREGHNLEKLYKSGEFDV